MKSYSEIKPSKEHLKELYRFRREVRIKIGASVEMVTRISALTPNAYTPEELYYLCRDLTRDNRMIGPIRALKESQVLTPFRAKVSHLLEGAEKGKRDYSTALFTLLSKEVGELCFSYCKSLKNIDISQVTPKLINACILLSNGSTNWVTFLKTFDYLLAPDKEDITKSASSLWEGYSSFRKMVDVLSLTRSEIASVFKGARDQILALIEEQKPALYTRVESSFRAHMERTLRDMSFSVLTGLEVEKAKLVKFEPINPLASTFELDGVTLHLAEILKKARLESREIGEDLKEDYEEWLDLNKTFLRVLTTPDLENLSQDLRYRSEMKYLKGMSKALYVILKELGLGSLFLLLTLVLAITGNLKSLLSKLGAWLESKLLAMKKGKTAHLKYARGQYLVLIAREAGYHV
jgi:hypothetical protein